MKLRLVEQACGCSLLRGGGGLKVRGWLCLPPALVCRVLAAMTTRQLQVSAFAMNAVMKLRLVEQACGCSLVRGGGGLKVREWLCLPPALVWRVLAATTTRQLQVSAFATEAAMKLMGLIEG